MFTHHQLNIEGQKPSLFLNPPDEYGQLSTTMYRSTSISLLNLPFLLQKSLRTILMLGEDPPSSQVLEILGNQGVQLLCVNLQANDPRLLWATRMDDFVKRSVEITLEKSNHPILLMSTSSPLLSTVIGCIRRMQNWNIQSIIEEFRRYTPGQSMSQYENYIERFDFDLITMPEDSFLEDTL